MVTSPLSPIQSPIISPLMGFPASGGAPASAITQLEVMGTTNLDPDGGAPNLGVNMPGALLRVRTVAIASTLPDATKFTVTVTDSGWDTSGNAVSRQRVMTPYINSDTPTATGGPTAILRRPSANFAAIYCEQGGVRVDVGSLVAGVAFDFYVVLPGIAYTGSTITVAVAAGWYGVAAVGSTPAVTNSSNVAYPDPIYGWMNAFCERVEASTYAVQLWCNGHLYAQSAQAVACVELWASDGANTGAHTIVSTPTLGTIQTREAIAEVFAATVSLAGVNDTDGTTVNGAGVAFIDGLIKPWIGPAYQLSVSGVTWPSQQPCHPLPFVKDTAGKYGGAIAYVNPGVAGATPTVSRTPAANYAAALVVAYATHSTAATAIAAFNNSATNRPAGAIIHNDLGGATAQVLLNAPGVAQAFEINSNVTQSPGNCWYSITNSSLNSGAAAFYNMANGRIVKHLTRGLAMDCNRSGASGSFNGNSVAGTMLGWYGGTMTWNAGTTGLWIQNCDFVTFHNVNMAYGSTKPTGQSAFAVGSQGTSNLKCIQTIGVTIGDSTGSGSALQTVVPYFVVGLSGFFQPGDPSSSTQLTNDGGVMDNTFNYKVGNNQNLFGASASTGGFVFTRGFYKGQSIIEFVSQNDYGPAGSPGPPAQTNNVTNILLEYLTVPQSTAGLGDTLGRMNHSYDMDSDTRGVRRFTPTHYNIAAFQATKADVFAFFNSGGVTGCTGGFYTAYNVECEGDALCVVRPATFTATDYHRKVIDPYGKNGVTSFAFTNNQAVNGGAGFGTYTLTGGSGNAAYGLVPAGHARRRYDIAGQPRRNDGTGAGGAYES